MRKFNYVCSLILAVMLPLMIVILSSNLVLRVSEIYVFHFNDSQVINEIPYNVTGSQMAKEISSYWSSFSGEAFQVEEDNGDYQDPIFEPDEQRVMGKVKNILNIELAAGLFCLAVTLQFIFIFSETVIERRFETDTGPVRFFPRCFWSPRVFAGV